MAVKSLEHPGATQAPPVSEREQALVRRVLAGERQGAVELYRMLLPAVDRTLRRVLGRREADYDDLVQQSFEQILRTLQDRRFSHACPLTAWATTITARVALTELRRRYRHRRHVEDTPWDSESGMSLNDWRQQTVMRERVLDVRRELGHLAPGYAWVVVLHDLEGHRLADIAVTLGISLTAAQSRLLRARKELVQRCSVGAGIESNTEVSHD